MQPIIHQKRSKCEVGEKSAQLTDEKQEETCSWTNFSSAFLVLDDSLVLVCVRYRKIRVGNEALQRRVGRHPSGLECIIAFGFQRQMLNGEEYLVLSEQAALNPELKVVRDQLSTALQGGKPVTK